MIDYLKIDDITILRLFFILHFLALENLDAAPHGDRLDKIFV